jgi:hypothetical protein
MLQGEGSFERPIAKALNMFEMTASNVLWKKAVY